MKRMLLFIACALLVASFPVAAQEMKSVQGTISAIDAAGLTLKVKDQEMKFAVDKETRAIAPGGSTQTRAAKEEGKPGPQLTDVFKVGQHVEVRYREAGMHAVSIRAIQGRPVTAAPADKSAGKTGTATGTVTAVSNTSLTVKGKDAEWTFTVDSKTDVIGTGIGTAARKEQAAGGKTTLTDFVANGDTVRVTYHDMEGTKHASEVRVTAKAKG